VNDFVRPESMQVPEGGLASFLTATVGDWADTEEQVPATGIGGVKAVADQLAEYGRYEDTYMVHAAEGETVIPMAVFDENPRLKASLFSQMRAMGIDPEQYVVGSELNSLNPVTGQPEFFLKKLFKGLKKAVKKVVKVIKKVAPLVLSVGLAMTPLGAIAGSALGSGIGTLIQGGSLKDALKMGAIGGLTAGLFKGVQGGFRAMKANQGFGTGFRAGVSSGLPGGTPYTPAGLPDVVESQGVAGPAASPTINVDTLSPQPSAAGDLGRLSGTSAPPSFTSPVSAPDPSIMDFQGTASGSGTAANLSQQGGDAFISKGLQTTPPPPPGPSTTPMVLQNPLGDVAGQTATASNVATDALTQSAPNISSTLPTDMGNFNINQQSSTAGFKSSVPPPQSFEQITGQAISPTGQASFTDITSMGREMRPTLGQSVQDFFKNPVQSTKDIFFPSDINTNRLVAERLGRPDLSMSELSDQFGQALVDKTKEEVTAVLTSEGIANPGLIRKYGPLAAAGTGILALTTDGQAEMEESIDPFGQDFKTGADLYRENPGKYSLFPQFYNNYNYAYGGNVQEFPRKDGAIAGPGTGTSDDIPAMLSDGEFVMTAKSVRGAGNGSRNKGVKKMYEIMRTYEGVA
jgi:hypothetical protein